MPNSSRKTFISATMFCGERKRTAGVAHFQTRLEQNRQLKGQPRDQNMLVSGVFLATNHPLYFFMSKRSRAGKESELIS